MCFTLHSHNIQRADQHNSRNSGLPISSVGKKITEVILHNIYTEKRCNNWHMISFIHCGSEETVNRYRFPGNQLSDAREGGGWCIVTQ